MIKEAYELGVRLAMEEALTKEARLSDVVKKLEELALFEGGRKKRIQEYLQAGKQLKGRPGMPLKARAGWYKDALKEALPGLGVWGGLAGAGGLGGLGLASLLGSED